MYQPGTGYTALYSCFNNWLQSVPTRYRLHSLGTALPPPPPPPTPLTGYRVIRPSPFNSVDSGAGRQQGSTNMASTDWLQSLQITRPVYRLYSLISTKTSYRVYPPSPFNSSGRCGSIYKNYFNRLAKYRPVVV